MTSEGQPTDVLPLGWRTDLAVLTRLGADTEEHADHVVVRSPSDPAYHWGNFVLVTDGGRVDDAAHWVGIFEAAFPDAGHRSVGLPAAPDPVPWIEAGMAVEHEDVLARDGLPEGRPLPSGYDVRPLLTQADWEQSVLLGSPDKPIDFVRRTREARTRMVAAGHTAWFGAWAGDTLVSELGIVDCGDGLARYRSVLTHPDHRRRGLTSHLLGVAAAWAGERGTTRWVIVADAGSDASRLYQTVGFGPVEASHQAYRPPA